MIWLVSIATLLLFCLVMMWLVLAWCRSTRRRATVHHPYDFGTPL